MPYFATVEEWVTHYFRASDAVFRGSALSIEPEHVSASTGLASGDLLIRFRVLEAWKGEMSGDSTVVLRVRDPFPCFSQFTQGKEYLVYAARDEQGGLVTSCCPPPGEPTPVEVNVLSRLTHGAH